MAMRENRPAGYRFKNGHKTQTVEQSEFLKEMYHSEEKSRDVFSQTKHRLLRPRNTVLAQGTPREDDPTALVMPPRSSDSPSGTGSPNMAGSPSRSGGLRELGGRGSRGATGTPQSVGSRGMDSTAPTAQLVMEIRHELEVLDTIRKRKEDIQHELQLIDHVLDRKQSTQQLLAQARHHPHALDTRVHDAETG